MGRRGPLRLTGGHLTGFVLRRLLLAVPLLLGVVAVNFALIQAAPGDPVSILVGDYPAPPDYVAQVRRDFGLDRPIPVQIASYLGQVAQGNLGYSFANRQPVAALVWGRLGFTLELTGAALAWAGVAGIALGALAARVRGSWLDGVVQAAALGGYSVPEFWLGQVLILVFAVWLGWLPSQGAQSLRGAHGFVDQLRYLLLPAFALSFRYLALIARITRAAAIEAGGAEFVLAARARGVRERTVLWSHTLRNAAAPVLTVIGYNAGFMLAGSALIETVFGWPGIGRLLYTSISQRDTPVMMAILLLVSVTVVLANLLTDILHRLLDPRIVR